MRQFTSNVAHKLVNVTPMEQVRGWGVPTKLGHNGFDFFANWSINFVIGLAIQSSGFKIAGTAAHIFIGLGPQLNIAALSLMNKYVFKTNEDAAAAMALRLGVTKNDVGNLTAPGPAKNENLSINTSLVVSEESGLLENSTGEEQPALTTKHLTSKTIHMNGNSAERLLKDKKTNKLYNFMSWLYQMNVPQTLLAATITFTLGFFWPGQWLAVVAAEHILHNVVRAAIGHIGANMITTYGSDLFYGLAETKWSDCLPGSEGSCSSLPCFSNKYTAIEE